MTLKRQSNKTGLSTVQQPVISRLDSEFVHSVIELVVGVGLHLDPLDVVNLSLLPKTLPKILVFDRVAGRSLPVTMAPPNDPTIGKAFSQILTVSVEQDLARRFECTQGFQGRLHFHPVVGGSGIVTRQNSFALAVF